MKHRPSEALLDLALKADGLKIDFRGQRLAVTPIAIERAGHGTLVHTTDGKSLKLRARYFSVMKALETAQAAGRHTVDLTSRGLSIVPVTPRRPAGTISSTYRTSPVMTRLAAATLS
jgi:hypothetical protein